MFFLYCGKIWTEKDETKSWIVSWAWTPCIFVAKGLPLPSTEQWKMYIYGIPFGLRKIETDGEKMKSINGPLSYPGNLCSPRAHTHLCTWATQIIYVLAIFIYVLARHLIIYSNPIQIVKYI